MHEPVHPPAAPKPPRRRSVVGPVILIILGLAFLAQNLNLVDLDIWALIWRLWPVCLIAAGLDLILGRQTPWGAWVVLGLVLAIIGGVVWFDANVGFPTGTGESISVRQPIGSARSARVVIDASVADLQISGASSPYLAEGTLIPGQYEWIDQRAHQVGDTLHLDLKSRGAGWIKMPFRSSRDHPTWHLLLSDQVPIDLRINTGVGLSRVDLSHVRLTSLQVDAGVGETVITLPSEGRFQVDIDTGVGEVTLRLPEGLAARIAVDKGLGDLNLKGAFVREGNTYLTADYGTAQSQAEIKIDAGVGDVTIETYR